MMEKTAGDNKQHCVLREFKRENLSKVCFVVDSRGKNQNSNWMVSLTETPKYKEART